MAYKKKKKTVETSIVKAVITKPIVTTPKPFVKTTVEKTSTLRARKFLLDLKGHFTIVKKQLPLAIGIEKQIQEAFPQQPKRIINVALYLHTHSHKYLKNLHEGNNRFNLDGGVAQSIDEVAKKTAKDSLCAIRRKVKALREGKHKN